MPDPAAALHVPTEVLARDLGRGRWLGMFLGYSLWTASAAPLLITDALPLVTRGETAVAVVTGAAALRGSGRLAVHDLPVEWATTDGRRVAAVLAGLTSGPPVGGTVPILYSPETPRHASRTPWLFRFLVVLPLAAGLGLAWLGLRDRRRLRDRIGRVQAMLAEGRCETVRVTGVERRGRQFALSWQAEDGRRGERVYGPGGEGITPGTPIALWISADGREVWDDGQVRALWGRHGT